MDQKNALAIYVGAVLLLSIVFVLVFWLVTDTHQRPLIKLCASHNAKYYGDNDEVILCGVPHYKPVEEKVFDYTTKKFDETRNTGNVYIGLDYIDYIMIPQNNGDK